MNDSSKYDINGFANELGLTLEEVWELYAELINELSSAAAELKILIREKDLEKIHKIIHNIKGVSGNYRITDIYKQTTKINNDLKSYYYNDLETDLINLFKISDKAINEIQNFFNIKSVLI